MDDKHRVVMIAVTVRSINDKTTTVSLGGTTHILNNDVLLSAINAGVTPENAYDVGVNTVEVRAELRERLNN